MKNSKPLILPFTNIRATDLPLVGGKGANLGELTHVGFPIPPGFCLTTVAFQQFMASSPDAADLYARLETVSIHDVEAVRRVGQRVRQALLDLPMPPNIADAVRAQWQQFGPEQAYAVRSSATAEDLPDASFAGQQDTYLNIRGESALLDAVQRCWVSLFTDRAIVYRAQNQFSHQEVQLSVVVQQMVMAETSGILFTADPLTGHRHTVSIDAGFGLGEALVSGLVSPDAYRVDKQTETIIDRQIADKALAIFPKEDGGVRQEMLSIEQRAQTVLTDSQILALAAMGTKVEAHYGFPQDIEWAIVGGQDFSEELYLLQARPITSLYPIDGLQSTDGTLHIYFSMGHQQMMTNVMSPLGRSSLRTFIPAGHANGEIESTVVRASGGRLFMDITAPLHHPILRKMILAVLSQFDALLPESAAIAMQRPAFKQVQRLRPSLSVVGQFFRALSRAISALLWRDLTSAPDDVNALIDQQLARVEADVQAASTDEARICTMIDTMRSMFPVMVQWMPRFAVGQIADRVIGRMSQGWADPADLEAYNLGLAGNVVNEMNMAVGDMADLARQSPRLRTLFEQLGDKTSNTDSHVWLAEAAQVEDGTLFMQAWDQFMARYGARGPSEIDIMMPRWYEEPLPLLQVIASHLKKEEGSHWIQHQQLAQAREAAIARLLAQANRGLLGGVRARVLRRLIHVAHCGGVLREHHKFMVVQTMRIFKEQLKGIADRFVEVGKLSTSDDIWFLTWPELLAVSCGRAVFDNVYHSMDDASQTISTGELVLARRDEMARFQKMKPPLLITSDGETPVVKYSVADAPPGALVGNPVSAGVVEGTVHVIRDPQVDTIEAGEILVAPFTDPGWTPLFINASGLIMEVGGVMNHGAVVAREYGIPAVVGVRDATEILQTGQQVRIDGNRGIIEVL